MSDRSRDWDKELADIDRVIEEQGPTPGAPGTPALPPGAGAAPPARVPAAAEPGVARRSVAKTWFWVLLAVLLAAALPLWPYGKVCGLQLFFYLGAATLALLAGAAGAVSSWKTRRGLAHLISLVVLVWAGVMAAREVLPRVGYAAETRTWLCPTTPEPAPPAPTRPAPDAPEPAP
jgi:hypothetical protein